MINLLYIASPSYSGSTLLTFLLNTHPAIATIGELKWGDIDLETYHCSCGALLKECGFWGEVGGRVQQRGLPFELGRPATHFRCRGRPVFDRLVRAGVRGPLFEGIRDVAVAALAPVREDWTLVRQVNRAMIEIILELQTGTVFLDGSKDPVRLKHLHETGDYDIRVIELMRDGRAVLNSAIKNQGAAATAAARDWLKTHQQIDRMRRRLGSDRVLTLHYEDLCADTARSLHRIWRFTGLAPHRVPENYRTVPHHILGNRMRLRPAAPITPDDSWRATLPEPDLRVFERIGGRANQAYGYV